MDAFITGSWCSELLDQPLNMLFSTLIRPHTGSSSAGIAFDVTFPTTGYQVYWNVTASTLVLVDATGSVLATLALDDTVYNLSGGGWAELTVQVKEAPGATGAYQVAATLVMAPLSGPPTTAVTPARLNYSHAAFSRTAFSHLFGFTTPAGSASFAYVFQRTVTAANSLI
jgi:hypothetical protein